MPLWSYGISGKCHALYDVTEPLTKDTRAHNRSPIQTLEDAKDTVQTLYVGSSSVITGSVDGFIRTYDLRKGELRSDFIGRERARLDFALQSIMTNIRPCNLRCAYPGRTNSSRYLPRRSYSVNGYVNRQNAERFHWTHEQFISVSCMFRACWRQCHLWRWERDGLGMGPPCCRFTFTSAAHFFLISRRPNPLTPILLRKLIQKWSPGQSTIHLTQMKW